MKNLSVIIASLDDTSPDRRGIGSPVRFPSNFNQSQQNDTSLPRAPTLGELARQRLRGWTKDAFRLSGITQVLLCTTSPSSSLRSMPPPLAGEALAFRHVFQQVPISFSENETSLPRAPLLGELSSECETGRLYLAAPFHPLRHLSRSYRDTISQKGAGVSKQSSIWMCSC